jgi:hypothetical protein
MAGSQGFQVDLNELSTLATVNIPYIEQCCSQAETTLKNNAAQDSAIFDETATDSTLYVGVSVAFTEARSDLEYLLDSLSSSLGQCAKALSAIHDRYAGTDGTATRTFTRTGQQL